MAPVVLVVEDDRDIRGAFTHALNSYGYETVEAANGAEAIEKAGSTKPDLILMDIELPDMTGVEVAQAMGRDSITKAIPIIGCSAFGKYREAALEAGMVDYLIKPVSSELITAKVREFICISQHVI
jgi:two-component system cell cycle response regulator DivK